MRNLSPLARVETNPPETSPHEATPHPTKSLPRWERVYDVAAGAQALVESYRLHGYCRASINPLDTDFRDSMQIAELNPRTYGLDFDDAVRYPVDFGAAARSVTLWELLGYLQATYCGSISIETAHVRSLEQRRWLYTQMETRIEAPAADDREPLRILARLAAAEAFDHFHRANCAHSKQFSLEGSESLVVLLRTTVEQAARHGVEDIVLGMPHRGRLNMMLNALDVPAKQMMSLFSGNPEPSLAASDIKDHAGFSRQIETLHGAIRVLLARNPSHLESVSPVVCGMARSLQDRKIDASGKKVMPVLVHGDASFSGQGIVTETLNMSQTRGYGVGGTVHLILNNQIGSASSHPRDARSTLYSADIARAVDAPVVHVNADDPDAVAFAARLATDYRMRFGADIVVDQMGYRRYGHFVGDDPKFTQPATQRRIDRHRTVTELYAEQLIQRGLIVKDTVEQMKRDALAAMTEALANKDAAIAVGIPPRNNQTPESPEARRVHTAVPQAHLRAIVERLAAAPAGFALHAGVDELRQSWQSVARDADGAVDWRLAENLAYGTLLANGFNVRLSGLDVGRGTFVHRQHVWHDQSADAEWQKLHVPLRHVADSQGAFSIFESPLSEEAVLGFEYGYSLQCGRDLVVWEAQFGDFVNNAQVIIDQFVSTGESKWDYESGLVMLLPHGYDGWGPDHSSAYLGRFLQLCAGDNMRVAMPSTAAQWYHLLRRQALMKQRKPLIVMTPKLLFYARQQSYSRLDDLAQDEFRPLLGEKIDIEPTAVVRAIVTSGKVYYDLAQERSERGVSNLPILRVEELYPFPTNALREELARFPQLKQVVWAQEEAKNHGAWHLVRDQLEAALPPGVSLAYAGRCAAASTAVCNAAQHLAQRQELVAEALGVLPARKTEPGVLALLTEAGRPATEQTRRSLPLQALPTLHKASDLIALPPGGKLEGRLPDETAALRRVATWAKEFLTRPHPDLGRSGHVCPWVNASIRTERFLLALTPRAHENLSAAEQTLLRLKRYFLEEMQPTSGREAQLKTIVVLFTGLPPDEVPSIINGLHARLKPQFVREGLMLGEFFSKCEKEGLRNPEFRPLRSETPLIVIRSMVQTDIAFLADDATFVRAYLRKFQASGVDEVFSLLEQRPDTPRDQVAMLLNTVAEFDGVSDGRPVEKDRSTGLFKSPQLLRRLESELQRAAPMTSETVMVLGVDALESSLGSDKDNEASHVLWDVARMVKSGQRAESLLVRHGSDSLALLVPHMKPELAGILAERIRAACETRPTTPEASSATTLSIGIATVTKGWTQAVASDVLAAAERACAAARAEGGNRIVVADLPTGCPFEPGRPSLPREQRDASASPMATSHNHTRSPPNAAVYGS